MSKLPPAVESAWPKLKTEGYQVKSKSTLFTDKTAVPYNCIAFAADVQDEWWEPDAQGNWAWPIAKREFTLECYAEAYRSKGYEDCDNKDVEAGYEKIAIYTLNNIPTHAAKQLPDGRWKSKLGQREDIEHNTTEALENPQYGAAQKFMKRKLQVTASP